MWIKIVPDASPNDDGDWIEVNTALPNFTHWEDTEKMCREYVPEGHHAVAASEKLPMQLRNINWGELRSTTMSRFAKTLAYLSKN